MPATAKTCLLTVGALIFTLSACSMVGTKSSDTVAAADAGVARNTTPPTANGLAPCVPLTATNPAFTAPSWGPGIVFEASGFIPLALVTLNLSTTTGNGISPTSQTLQVSADSNGNLGSIWTPSTPPQAPNAIGYPKYSIWAISGDTTQNLVVTCPVQLTITS